MARRATKSPLKAAKSAVRRAAKKLSSRLHTTKESAAAAPGRKTRARTAKAGAAHARPARREADIPLDVLNHTYTPKQTSLKASFRASGEERQRDQELAGGFADDRWSDEDRITNKSGDPRIGTHHRKYEPGE
ncbi:MAG TPA: hypothetical protein VL284_19615 [Thermoanaerobaculia bacterium]|nr:hypothetical protein [Thermoanaerobaculia bacterium]